MSRRSLLSPDDTRTAILDAAETLFRTVGYGKTTVADIAGALGMSNANVYRFFASKAEINDAICRRITAAMRAEMIRAGAEGGMAAERLARMIETLYAAMLTLLTDEKRVLDMVDVAVSEDWDSVKDHIVRVHALVADVVRDGIAAGEFTDGDPHALAVALMDACCGLWHPTLIAECLKRDDTEIRGRRVVWLALNALTNRERSAMP